MKMTAEKMGQTDRHQGFGGVGGGGDEEGDGIPRGCWTAAESLSAEVVEGGAASDGAVVERRSRGLAS